MHRARRTAGHFPARAASRVHSLTPPPG